MDASDRIAEANDIMSPPASEQETQGAWREVRHIDRQNESPRVPAVPERRHYPLDRPEAGSLSDDRLRVVAGIRFDRRSDEARGDPQRTKQSQRPTEQRSPSDSGQRLVAPESTRAPADEDISTDSPDTAVNDCHPMIRLGPAPRVKCRFPDRMARVFNAPAGGAGGAGREGDRSVEYRGPLEEEPIDTPGEMTANVDSKDGDQARIYRESAHRPTGACPWTPRGRH